MEEMGSILFVLYESHELSTEITDDLVYRIGRVAISNLDLVSFFLNSETLSKSNCTAA